ncbi:unnamed protein product [Moneuplotes crassus]|uniref:Kri1-like C-terminal domain-containing protein n=1 Tax=Euplotes crassus TaxID=5936 RepID=A0AAD2DAW9_EUPCR|nr:unnamed protein product [Moneuplotes crassus]
MSNKKSQLFGEEDQVQGSTKLATKSNLNVNKAFADKFEKRETKKLLQKGKQMESEEDSSEYSDEDSEGVLINDTVEHKFLETIARIRANDPQLKEAKENIFEDKDFDIENIKEKPKEEKPVTFKSMMAEKVKKRFGKNLEKNIDEVSDHDSEAEDEEKKETDVQLQKRLKADFLKAADDEAEVSDSDILMVKEKTKEELQKETEEMKKYEEIEKQKKMEQNKFLNNFWTNKANKKLTEEDKFLRSYILGEKWKEIEEDIDEDADEEDFERDSEMEEFEENYNFRFEERDGDKIRTYPRTIEDTYRIARNRRMENKIAKKKRMKEYIKEKKQEMEQIANIKKQEIMKKVQQAEEIAGSHTISKKLKKELETDFNPKAYDKIMAKAFNDDYYEEDDQKEKVFEKTVVDDYPEVNRYEEKPQAEGEGDEESKEDKEDDKEPEITEEQAKLLKKKREVKQAFKKLEEEGDFDIWYSCDGCMDAIKPGKFRFDCKICDNFTFCQKCFKNNQSHSHPFKKKKVPGNLAPPENKEKLLSEAYMLCSFCKVSLLDKSKRAYLCQDCNFYLCKDCKKDNCQGHNVQKEKKRITEEEETQEKSQFLDGMLEDYYNTGFEDIIGKDIYTRFKYTNVKKSNFGLSNDEILLLNDKELNNLVSLKKYKPYRNDEDRINLHKVNHIKKKLSKRIEDERKQLKKVLKQDIKLQKEKLLGIKTDAKEQMRQLRRNEKAKERKQEKKEMHTGEGVQKQTGGKRNRKDLYGI